MNSSAAVLTRGHQEPRYCSLPPAPGRQDFADQGVALADLAGFGLDPWQELALRAKLRRDGGQWAAYEVCEIVPRQNGKSVGLEAYDLAKLYLCKPPHLILHTAHQFATANESFRHLLGLVRAVPELWAEVLRVSNAPGEKLIELKSGSRLRFAARTVTGAGRGFSPDTVVFDEAYRLPPETMSALTPALSAKPDPQIVYASSTGYPESEALWMLVERGRRGNDPTLAYLEWSACAGCDLDDRAAWAQANPALGYRLSERKIAAERAALRDEDFARERLGLWADVGANLVIPMWRDLAVTDGERPIGKVAFAVHSTRSNSATSISVAGKRRDGHRQVQVVEHRAGQSWAVARMAELAAEWHPCAVVVDPVSTAGSLIEDLGRAGVEVTKMTAQEAVQACSQFYTTAVDGQLAHFDQSDLNEALKGAVKRELASAWVWDQRNVTVDISPLVSATNALWGWTTRHGRGLQIF